VTSLRIISPKAAKTVALGIAITIKVSTVLGNMLMMRVMAA
jgi:hypothetical protein